MSFCLKYQGWIYFPDIERKEGKQEGRAEEKERRAKEKKKQKLLMYYCWQFSLPHFCFSM